MNASRDVLRRTILVYRLDIALVVWSYLCRPANYSDFIKIIQIVS